MLWIKASAERMTFSDMDADQRREHTLGGVSGFGGVWMDLRSILFMMNVGFKKGPPIHLVQ